MTVADARTLFAFNDWANHKLLAVCRGVAADAFVRDLGTSYRSLRNTLVHIMWAEWIWLQRWLGESPGEVFKEEHFPDVDAIESRWRGIEQRRGQLVNEIAQHQLDTPLSYLNLRGERWAYPVGHMMQHVVNHSSYHRGQVVTLLRQLGYAAPSTDFLVYFDEAGQ